MTWQADTTPIRTSIIGFGLAGRVFHAPFVSAVPGLQLVSIMQRSGDEASRAWPTTKIFRSVDDVLASDARLVVVGTPNETHFDIAMRCLQAGKHVVVDKPLAATSAEAAAMIRLATEKNLVLAPFHNRRWDGDFLTVRALLMQGALGRLTTFESHFDRFRPIPRAGTWKEASHPANGMLFDLGPHLLDQVLCLFGPPQAITASVRTDRDNSAIEDAFDITLHYPRMLAHCRATMIAADTPPRFHLHGTKGSFRKYGLDRQEPAIVAGAKVPRLGSNGKPEPGDDWLGESSTRWGKIVIAQDPEKPAELTTYEVETELGDYRGFYLNVRDAIRGSGILAVPAVAGFQVIRLLELARESSEAGRTIPVTFDKVE